MDIFGKTCTQELTTNAFTKDGKNYSVDLSFSNPNLTSETVAVTASSTDGYLTFGADGRYTGGNTVYNHLPNGARIILLKEDRPGFETWITLKGGQRINRMTLQ